MIATCCEWLHRMLATAGEQGTSVIAIRDGDFRQPYLQARPFTRTQARTWERLVNTEPLRATLAPLFGKQRGHPVPVLTLMRIPLLYCPHYGANLDELVARQREEFDVLAAEHRSFAER